MPSTNENFEIFKRMFLGSDEQIKELKSAVTILKDIISEKQQHLTDWIDSSEACQLLNISKRALADYKASGLIGYSKLLGKVYYKRSSIMEALENNFIKPKQYGTQKKKNQTC